ncbi:mitochondrial DNA-directed RNA polymeras-like protein [Cucurbitaria berberidis CBS 394.84]|uniref:DNA-directed RNA polymerase n=1 Tax=Cucurbitaria berberidis CBS 394.84 TaxID=1168544 RepID=A0A9P4G9B1_9PLEO|nr:mitochondrial DNA-directed RNA polymeras-like protein [Cucurbitaria berberidis CBS 394.84]KAF1841257.1 mitochondrial DNA-directed RNA polymeras-like protein [Cucurbitaria berberidis CBS 394.84]
MLARAARRKLRKDAFRTPTTLSDQLTLPWLCPAQLRRASNAATINMKTYDSKRQRRPSLSSRHDTRSLATAAELQPAPASLPYDPFSHAWDYKVQSPELSLLERWDTANPLIVKEVQLPPVVRATYGMGANPVELHQNLYACLRVGRMDRAAIIIQRLTSVYHPSAPEVVDAHNVYLQTLAELSQQDPKPDSMASIEKWYETQMIRKNIEPNAQTFVTLVRAAMNLLDEDAREDAVRRFLAMAHEYGPEVVDDINGSPDFSDEEWDMLIRLQPEAYEEPPTVEEVQNLHVSTPAGRKNLIDHGLVSLPHETIKPVPQKGVGLDSLKQALAMFETTGSVPYPHDMEGTQEEKDHAYAYARQLRMEQDAMEAAVDRWKHEDEKLQDIGIHGVLNTKPVQAMMYSWYSALVPLFKQQIERTRKILSAPLTDNKRDDAHGYGAWLERCKPETLAAITVARSVQSCVRGKSDSSSPLKTSTLSIAIGSDIHEHFRADAQARQEAFLKKQRKQTRIELVDKLSKTKTTSTTSPSKPNVVPIAFDAADMPLSIKTKIGALCLELLLKSATMKVTADDPKTGKQVSTTMAAFHHQVSYHQGKKLGSIVPHHELMTKLRTESVHSIQTVRLPMVVEPKAWLSFEDGGYYTSPQKVVRQKSGDTAQRVYAQSAIDNGDMNKVLAGLDVLGRVPWQVNAPVYDVMARVWNSGQGIGGLIGEDTGLERPQEPPADATYQERARWGKEMREYDNLRSGYHSQRCFQNFQLETAKSFLNEKRFYFPHSVDFRGRAYPIPPILNHIGSDLSRGLLKFAHGKELGTVGLQWLKIHLANLYGYDKASLREREQFAMDNIGAIYDSATNPLEGQRWWAKAEDPWQCLACCMELKSALDSPDPTRFVSQLPVHQDGTCNGLQHYAALGGDHAGARQVNLEPSNRPQDIYTGVAELVKEMVAKEAAEGLPYATFVNGHITRKVVKRTVMTNVYGVTFMGAKQQVQDELQHIFPNFKETETIRSLSPVALYVAYKIFNALGKIFNGAQGIQYWLGECGDRITTSLTAEQVRNIQRRFEGEAGTPYDSKYQAPKKLNATAMNKMNKDMEAFTTSIIWTTPLKMPIVQPYRKDTIQKIRTKIQDITVAKRSQSDVVDKRKQLQAFPPNFIHSLDATHMILSALKCSEMGLDFAAVHDSFWTHASDIPNLNAILRDAFVRMHSEDIIGRLAAEFATRYAGAMHRASILASSEVGRKINKWRWQHRKLAGKTLKNTETRQGDASFEEVALEAQRQELLKSEDPQERKKGEEMVTPTRIWLENQDPKAFSSFRLSLIGETKDKQSRDRQEEIKDKVLSAEADAVNSDSTEAVSRIESTLTVEEDLEVDGNPPNKFGITEQKKSASRIAADKGLVQVWIPLTFPPVPEKGDWDVSRLMESKYFFS